MSLNGHRLKVLSFTTDGVRYDVSSAGCSCPSTKDPCKHEKVAASAVALERRCHEAHGTAPGLVCVQCVADMLAITAGRVARDFVYRDRRPGRPARKAVAKRRPVQL